MKYTRNLLIALGLLVAFSGCTREENAETPPADPEREEQAAAVDPAAVAEEPAPAGDAPPVEPTRKAPDPPRKNWKVLSHLEADGDGLYSSAERKALLDVLQDLDPDLEGPFDLDNDGKVTVLEQTEGRHPLSTLVSSKRIVESDTKIPWTLDLFPEWIMTIYLQEDVKEGAVAEQPSRGTIAKPASQSERALAPRKRRAGAGVEFAENSGQHFMADGHRDARWNYRWCIFSFRIDAATGNDERTVLLDLNQGKGSSLSSPKIWYHKDSGLNIQYVGQNVGGLDRRVMSTKDVVADGKTWNVVVCGIRYGQMFASVNGTPLSSETPQLPRFSGDRSAEDAMTQIGDPSKGNMAWAYDLLAFGLTEPSEAMVRKMTGWAAHRAGVQGNLPADHPYAKERPILDEEDFPHRYVHDDEKWTEWGKSLKKPVTRVNAGGDRVEPEGFERVFFDDFRADRVEKSISGSGDLWVGPGFNTAVGVKAQLAMPGQGPDTYPYDAENGRQILSLVKQGNRWRGSAIYTVNDLGHGYTWTGPKVFRIRCMFPDVPQDELAKGAFPAFWSYGTEWLFWRTTNRIEVDYFEFDGVNAHWLNGLSTHYHYPHVKNIFAKNPKSYKRYKVYGGDLTEEKSGIPGGLYVWDGQFHTWEFVLDEDMTYINVTVPDENGEERWVEICRAPTAPTYLERLDLQINYALKARGFPNTDERQDFVVDWVEVLQKSDAIAEIPAPFRGRPTLSGSNAAGETVTCDANLDGITDVRYYWFADDYPLTYGPSNSYTLTAAEAGKTIRCMVKAVGALDAPEAWSDVLK